jgi:hypothetical protein
MELLLCSVALYVMYHTVYIQSFINYTDIGF